MGLCTGVTYAIKNGKNKLKKLLAKGIWGISEYTGIGLGRYAHIVYETMIGYRSKQVNKDFEA